MSLSFFLLQQSFLSFIYRERKPSLLLPEARCLLDLFIKWMFYFSRESVNNLGNCNFLSLRYYFCQKCENSETACMGNDIVEVQNTWARFPTSNSCGFLQRIWLGTFTTAGDVLKLGTGTGWVSGKSTILCNQGNKFCPLGIIIGASDEPPIKFKPVPLLTLFRATAGAVLEQSMLWIEKNTYILA